MNADDILSIDDIEKEAVEVPEWKDKDGKPMTVKVRGLTAEEGDAYERAIFEMRGSKVITRDNVRARLVAMSIVNGDGGRVFTDEQASALGKKSRRAIDRLYAVAARLSGLRKEDIEELEGN
jgi:hypothetical protein